MALNKKWRHYDFSAHSLFKIMFFYEKKGHQQIVNKYMWLTDWLHLCTCRQPHGLVWIGILRSRMWMCAIFILLTHFQCQCIYYACEKNESRKKNIWFAVFFPARPIMCALIFIFNVKILLNVIAHTLIRTHLCAWTMCWVHRAG